VVSLVSAISNDCKLLAIPKRLFAIQKRPFYTGNLNSETPGNSKNAFLHWGDVLGESNITPEAFLQSMPEGVIFSFLFSFLISNNVKST